MLGSRSPISFHAANAYIRAICRHQCKRGLLWEAPQGGSSVSRELQIERSYRSITGRSHPTCGAECISDEVMGVVDHLQVLRMPSLPQYRIPLPRSLLRAAQ